MLVSGSWDKTVKIWKRDSAGTFNCQSTLNAHSYWVTAVSWSTCGKWLVSGGDDKKINIYNAQTFQVKRSLRGHNGRDDCICHFDVLGRLVGAVNPQCPVSGHSDW